MLSRAAGLALAWAVTGCSASPPGFDRDAELDALMAADRDFAQATAERGAEGWAGYFLENGLMLPAGGPVVEGASAIRDRMEPVFSRPDYALTWEPLHAELARSGDLGYTYGRYQQTTMGENGERHVSIGKYVTIWKKGPDGKWKVALDIGNEGDPLGRQ